MKLYLASDHAGFKLKEFLKETLSKSYEIEDCGAYTNDSRDDYPDFIETAAKKVSHDEFSKGIVMGGSGQGEAIVANKIKGIRAAVFYGGNQELLRLSKLHNDANILSLGARFLSHEEALKAVTVWLETGFSQDERHMRRIEKIRKIEDHA